MATLMQPLLVALLTLIASLSASSAQATERQHHQVSETIAPGRDSCEHDRCAAPFYPNVLPSFNPNVLSAAPEAAITDVSSSSNVESSYYDTYFDQDIEVLPPSARTSAPSRNLPREILPQEILRQPHCTAHSLIYASKRFQNDPTTTCFNQYRSIISLPICSYAPSDFQYALYAFVAADSRSQDARFFMKFFRHGLSDFHLILNTGVVCYIKHEPLVRVHFNGSRQMIQLCFLVSRVSRFADHLQVSAYFPIPTSQAQAFPAIRDVYSYDDNQFCFLPATLHFVADLDFSLSPLYEFLQQHFRSDMKLNPAFHASHDSRHSTKHQATSKLEQKSGFRSKISLELSYVALPRSQHNIKSASPYQVLNFSISSSPCTIINFESSLRALQTNSRSQISFKPFSPKFPLFQANDRPRLLRAFYLSATSQHFPAFVQHLSAILNNFSALDQQLFSNYQQLSATFQHLTSTYQQLPALFSTFPCKKLELRTSTLSTFPCKKLELRTSTLPAT